MQDASPCALPPPALTRQAADNSENCRRLLAFVKHCTRDLARVAGAARQLLPDRRSAGGELQARMNTLTRCLLDAARALGRYTARRGRSFLLVFLTAPGDAEAFTGVEKELREAMAVRLVLLCGLHL